MGLQLDIGFVSKAAGQADNEDFCAAVLPEPGQEAWGAVAVVCDGVSTGGRGLEAAQTSAMSLVRDYYGTRQHWETTVALDRVLQAQNAWLHSQNKRRAPSIGLTTLTALVLRGNQYTVAHVGDSRAVLVRHGNVQALTEDHAVPHPDMRHQLLRAVGAEAHVVADYIQGEAQVGDQFVLMTDGVHGVLKQDLLDIRLQASTAQDAAEALVQAAIDAGTTDNASALVIRVLGLDSAVSTSLAALTERVASLGAPPLLKPGQVLDAWRIEEVVADNGVNLIYRAVDIRDASRRAALKALHPSRAHDAQERNMLAHEAWLAQRLAATRASKHLVGLLDAPGSASASAFYLTYAWLEGQTWQQHIEAAQASGTPLPLPQVLHWAKAATEAIGLLHQQSVIHRDIKPANIHVGSDGVLRILDLGVALTGQEPEATRVLHAGTPSFINPEQWGFSLSGEDEPQAVNAASDLFALGVSLYQLLTARLPYGEVLPYQTGRYFKDPRPPSRHNPQVPIWLDHIVLKAVSRDVTQRFETAEEMLLALDRGASRPLSAPSALPLVQRDPTMVWKIGLGVSVLFNLLLIFWLLFLPR